MSLLCYACYTTSSINKSFIVCLSYKQCTQLQDPKIRGLKYRKKVFLKLNKKVIKYVYTYANIKLIMIHLIDFHMDFEYLI